jgi:predicted RNA-binding protein with PUA-like domain
MGWWLFKTEPDSYSIDDLARDGDSPWDGIRNYQARNRLRDEVRVGDRVLIHHSSCCTPAIAGIAEVIRAAEPDPSQFNPQASGYDPKSSPDSPRWFQVTLRHVRTLPAPVPLAAIRTETALQDMELVRRPRLSVQKVTAAEAKHIQLMAKSQH